MVDLLHLLTASSLLFDSIAVADFLNYVDFLNAKFIDTTRYAQFPLNDQHFQMKVHSL